MNRITYFLPTLTLLLCAFNLIGQSTLESFHCPVNWYGRQLDNAFGGGLNAPQFNEADLNNDGIPDLIIFDRTGDILLPYLRLPDGNGWKFKEAREYARYFPKYIEWGLMRDYNGDGIQDLFTFNTSAIPGFKAFTGRYQNDTLTFDIYQISDNPANYFLFQLPNGTKTQIYVAFDDIPSIDDIDGDGDLDLITFDPGGGYAHLYKNQSIEKGYGLDSLDFYQADLCWGKFYESGTSEHISLSTSPNTCAQSFGGEGPVAQIRHAGSTLLTLDMNNDGLKEIMLGDVSFSNITLLTNGGTPQNAWMIAQDTFWPKNDIPVNMPIFPAIYEIDLDWDGSKDLIVAPNLEFGALDTANIWLYRNIGSTIPEFKLDSKDLFVGGMLDVGTGARPAFMDINGDALLDLIIGNFGYFTPGINLKPSLSLFLNTGTPEAPAFTLESVDFLNLSDLSPNNIFAFTPAAGDLDSDGDNDLMVGHSNGTLFYFENLAGPGSPAQFAPYIPNYQNLSSGSYSVPQLVDVNNDGLTDILIGSKVGNIKYFQNIGSTGNPTFNSALSVPPNTDIYGKIDMRFKGFLSGNASPWMYNVENGKEMVIGSNAGYVRRYSVNLNDPTAAFPVLDSLYTGYRDGFETHPVMVDLDNDGLLDIVIGNLRGGLTAYKTGKDVVSAVSNVPLPVLGFSANYNDMLKQITFSLNDAQNDHCNVEILDVVGRAAGTLNLETGTTMWSTSNLPSGIYIIRAWHGNRQKVVKIAVAD